MEESKTEEWEGNVCLLGLLCKCHQLGGLKQWKFICLATVLGAKHLRSKYQQSWFCPRVLRENLSCASVLASRAGPDPWHSLLTDTSPQTPPPSSHGVSVFP